MSNFNLGILNYESQFGQEEYNSTYSELKKKYGKRLIDNWCECTDPAKFVHEDIGIASYLLILWKPQFPCNFVDLGCGNGLLVYILTQEGHVGRGLDVRRRKIWNQYPSSTNLEVETVIPSKASVYPKADWLIGNHSDELTAWLPIMAARSNSSCQFFTIPCCPFKLDGSKFQRRNSQLSVYQDFLEYVQEMGELCGFSVTADKMKIPSTKRVCLIGRRNVLETKSEEEIENNITKILSKECPSGVGKLNDVWVNNFKPRVTVEPVRNCSQVPQSIQIEILKRVSKILTAFDEPVQLPDGRTWNQGSTLLITSVAHSISPLLLQKLRLECKGLQTLLKNHHQVFEVRKGTVSLRSPESLRKNSEIVRGTISYKWKQKACWFHAFHPNGCPLPESDCSYDHSNPP